MVPRPKGRRGYDSSGSERLPRHHRVRTDPEARTVAKETRALGAPGNGAREARRTEIKRQERRKQEEWRKKGKEMGCTSSSRNVPCRNSRHGAEASAIPCRNLRHLRDRGIRLVCLKLREPRVSFPTVIYDTSREPRVTPYRCLRHLGRSGCHSAPLFTADG